VSAAAPYARLSPDAVLAAVEAAGFCTDGRLLALPSYENRVYQVGIEDAQPLVAKFYRPGRWSDAAIAQEHAFAHELAAADIPVVAPLVVAGRTLLRSDGGFRHALYPRCGGRAPELESADHLAWMGRLLARLHGVGSRARFRARGSFDTDTFVHDAARAVLRSGLLPERLHAIYRARTDALAAAVDARFTEVDPMYIRLHGDCHAGNVLWTDGGPHFVDLDDARMGPAVQDLWMLAPSRHALDALLEGYAQFRDFDRRELALVEPLRVMRQVHWAGWVAARWHDPAFPRAFGHVGEARWWEQHVDDLGQALASLQEPV
jgi:Ser/Thr protein kinase RdoA (MazF antagonist)